jgi:hypothetical protein
MDYRSGDYTLDTEYYELRRAGTLIKLRPKVFEVLAYLIAHRERLVSNERAQRSAALDVRRPSYELAHLRCATMTSTGTPSLLQQKALSCSTLKQRNRE